MAVMKRSMNLKRWQFQSGEEEENLLSLHANLEKRRRRRGVKKGRKKEPHCLYCTYENERKMARIKECSH